MKKFEFLEHIADLKIRAFGKNFCEVFENFTLAVSEYLACGKKVGETKKRIILINGNDYKDLLYNFLDEIIYLLDAEDFLVSRAEVNEKTGRQNIEVIFHGDKTENYEVDHIKAATYSEMYFKKTWNGWEAQAVLDV